MSFGGLTLSDLSSSLTRLLRTGASIPAEEGAGVRSVTFGATVGVQGTLSAVFLQDPAPNLRGRFGITPATFGDDRTIK